MHAEPFLRVAVTLPFLGEVVALLAVSVLIAYVCYRLKLVSIAGFLIAGVVLGPGATGVVEDIELINSLAEIGVILLLFTIGVEFSLEKLASIARMIFVGGGIQVFVTIALVAGILALFGVSWPAGIFTGCLVALSSTAIVLKLLADRAETDTPAGQLSLAVLIFQDLAIVAMVLLVPILGGQGGTFFEVAVALGTALGLVGAVLVLARQAVPWLLHKIALTRREELFLLTVVALCFGTAYLTSLAGVSLALGAFLAGLVVSESRYSDQALSEMLPLRTVFNAVFFVSVGMLLDLSFVLANLPLVLGVAVVVLLLKVLITGGAVLVLGYPVRIAAMVGLALAQIGEFSFVLDRAGRAVGLTPAGLGETGEQTFIAAVVLLMIATPFLVGAGPAVGAKLERLGLRRRAEDTPELPDAQADTLEDHVIIVGYGPAGRRLGTVLKDTGIPFVVVELNPKGVEDARADGLPVLYGDASRPHLLERAHIHEAKMCVVVINDNRAAGRIVQQARYLNPTLQIIVRTRFHADIEPLHEAGADVVVPEELETTVRIFSNVLGAYLIPPSEIQRQVGLIRSDDYGLLRGSIHEAHLMVLQGLDEEGLHTRAVAVREGAPVAGKTLEELALRRLHNLTVLAVRRDGRTVGNPAGDFRVATGDRLVLVGPATQFAACADLFRPSARSQ